MALAVIATTDAFRVKRKHGHNGAGPVWLRAKSSDSGAHCGERRGDTEITSCYTQLILETNGVATLSNGYDWEVWTTDLGTQGGREWKRYSGIWSQTQSGSYAITLPYKDGRTWHSGTKVSPPAMIDARIVGTSQLKFQVQGADLYYSSLDVLEKQSGPVPTPRPGPMPSLGCAQSPWGQQKPKTECQCHKSLEDCRQCGGTYVIIVVPAHCTR